MLVIETVRTALGSGHAGENTIQFAWERTANSFGKSADRALKNYFSSDHIIAVAAVNLADIDGGRFQWI